MKTMKFECPRCLGKHFYEPNEDDKHYVCVECNWFVSPKNAKKMNNAAKLASVWDDLQYAQEHYNEAEAELNNAQRKYDLMWDKVYNAK